MKNRCCKFVVAPLVLLCLHAGAHALEIRPDGVATAFAAGDPIGTVRSGPGCASEAPRQWSELLQQRVLAELPEVFREETAGLGITPASDPRAGVDVKAFLNDMDLRVCDLGKGAWRGGLRVQISWQVLAAHGARVLYQASTEGSFTRGRSAATAASGLRAALAVAVRNLLTDKRFASALRAADDGRTLADATRR